MEINNIMESLKALSQRTVIIILAVYAIFSTLGWLYYSEESAEKSATILLNTEAIEAVDSYVEKTADTGEMDDFIHSEEGQLFYSLTSE